MKSKSILEGKAQFEDDYDLFSKVLAFLWEGGVIESLNEGMNDRFTFVFLQIIGQQLLKKIESALAIGLDGIAEGKEKILGKIGRCEHFDLIVLRGLLELFW